VDALTIFVTTQVSFFVGIFLRGQVKTPVVKTVTRLYSRKVAKPACRRERQEREKPFSNELSAIFFFYISLCAHITS